MILPFLVILLCRLLAELRPMGLRQAAGCCFQASARSFRADAHNDQLLSHAIVDNGIEYQCIYAKGLCRCLQVTQIISHSLAQRRCNLFCSIILVLAIIWNVATWMLACKCWHNRQLKRKGWSAFQHLCLLLTCRRRSVSAHALVFEDANPARARLPITEYYNGLDDTTQPEHETPFVNGWAGSMERPRTARR